MTFTGSLLTFAVQWGWLTVLAVWLLLHRAAMRRRRSRRSK